jgi:hypothetical protein
MSGDTIRGRAGALRVGASGECVQREAATCGAEQREQLAEYTMVDDDGRYYRLVTPWRSVTVGGK